MVAPDRDIAQAKGFIAPPGYRRHRPETTLLYQLVAEHYPKFRDRRVAEGRALPRYVEDEFEAYLKCGLLEHGFLRVKCDSCRAEKLVAYSCKRSCDCQHRGAHNDRADSRAPQPGRRAGRSGVSGPCAAPGRVVVLTALHCWPPRRRRAGLGLRPDARAFLDGTRRFAQQITPDPGGSALTSGLG